LKYVYLWTNWLKLVHLGAHWLKPVYLARGKPVKSGLCRDKLDETMGYLVETPLHVKKLDESSLHM